MVVSDLMDVAGEVLQDTEHITYTEAQLIGGINRACLATVLVKPDACADLFITTLVDGPLQSLPDGALRLQEAYYRLDSDNRPVAHISMVEREEFDFLPSPEPDVQNVAYSEKLPEKFWVNPSAVAGVKLALLCSKVPDPMTMGSDLFALTEKYSEPVVEYLLYLMFRRDSERTPNANRAQLHRQSFFDLLNIKTSGDSTVSAETKRVSGF